MLAQRARALLSARTLNAALPAAPSAAFAVTALRFTRTNVVSIGRSGSATRLASHRGFASARDDRQDDAVAAAAHKSDGHDASSPPAAPPQNEPTEKESAIAPRWRYRHWKGELDLKNLHQTPPPPAEQPPSPPPPTILQRSEQALRSTVGQAQHAIHEPAIVRQWGSRAWAATKSGAHHLWTGTKLLGADIATAVGLIRKMARGEELSWRERRQLRRTAADLARVGPFLVIVLVPFMELALPLLLKVWPGFLPSTFQSPEKSDNRVQREMKLRLGIAEVLQEAVQNLAKKHVAADKDGDGDTPARSAEATQLLELLSEVRHGRRIPSAELSKLAPLFADTLTLDKLSRKQLVRLSRFFGCIPYLSDNMLRFQLQRKIHRLRQDDRLLEQQLRSLSKSELRAACHERGIRSVGLTEEGYRRQLRSWLNLSLKYNVPDSLLLLSRPIGLLEQRPSDNQIREALLEFDEAALDEIVPADQEQPIDNAERLKLLRIENRRIQEEEKQRKAEEAEQKTKEQTKKEAASASSSASAAHTDEPSVTSPSSPSSGRVDLFDLSSQLLSLLHRELESDRSLREKAQQLKDKHAQSHPQEHAHDESAKAAPDVAKCDVPPSPAPAQSAAPAATSSPPLSSKLLASFLDSKIESMLREIEKQLGTDENKKQEDDRATESLAESDESVRRWIERTLAQRNIRISEEEASRLQYMLQAMCESEKMPLTKATLEKLMRMTEPTEGHGKDADTKRSKEQGSK